MNTRIIICRYLGLAATVLLFCGSAPAEEEEHHEGHEGEDESLVLSEAERQAAGIETDAVARQRLLRQLRLPGEVIPNAYRSAKVAPRITAPAASA